MVCHGGFSLDESVRRSWYNPEGLLKQAGLKEGGVFVDVGCGDGFFAFLASSVVGDKGAVYAVDSDVSAIEKLKRKAAEQGLNNLNAVVGAGEQIVLCNGCADVVFYGMVLHDFNDPTMVLRNAKIMLKPSGLLVNLDWKKLQMPFGPPFQIRFSEQEAVELITQAGLTVENVKDAGPYHYVIHAKR
ncbi:MAG: class I SAM-dependent methyltransferase [Candidatus Bathyarchaeota archaeon]|nr:class I SAM-dependent methyltransferase [Candidatus Bathyarchaeota archaeon]